MHFVKIAPTWGVYVTGTSVSDLLSRTSVQEKQELQRMVYEHKVVVFRGLGNLSRDAVQELSSLFGRIWSPQQYDLVKDVDVEAGVMTFSNKTDFKSMNANLPWHRDIGWYREMKYPLRVLAPLEVDQNSEPTVFMDATAALDYLTHRELGTIKSVEVQIQHLWSWSAELKRPLVEPKWIPLLEEHPYTGKLELLLDSFGPRDENQRFSTRASAAWLTDARVSGDEGPRAGTSYLNRLHIMANSAPGNVFSHHWQRGDFLIFDNQSGIMHRRGPITEANATRSFYRVNINHPWQKENWV